MADIDWSKYPALQHARGHGCVDTYSAKDVRKYLSQLLADVRREAMAEGIREGVELAKKHAEVSEHDGWHKHDPIVDWQFVDSELDRLREGEEKKSDE